MSVEFQEDLYIPRGYGDNITKTNKFGMFLINKKIAKDEKQANIIMLSITIVFLLLTGLIVKTLVAQEVPETIPYDQLPASEKAKIPEPVRNLIESAQ